MNSPRISTRRELELMHQLQQLADQRASAERSIEAAFNGETSAAQTEFEETARRLNEQLGQQRRTLETEYATAKRAAFSTFEFNQQQAIQAHQAARKANDDRRQSLLVGAEHHFKDLRWQATAVFDSRKNQPQQYLDETAKRIQGYRRHIEGLERDALTLVDMRGLTKAVESIEEAPLAEVEQASDGDGAETNAPANPDERLQAKIAEIRQAVLDLQDQKIAAWFLEGGQWLGWVAAPAAICAIVGGLVGNLTALAWILGGLVGLAIGGASLALFIPRGKRTTLAQYRKIRQLIEQAREPEQAALAEAKVASERLAEENLRRRDADFAAAQQKLDQQRAEVSAQHAAAAPKIEADFAEQIKRINADHDRAVAEAEAKYPPQLEQNRAEQQKQERENSERFDARRAAAIAKHERQWEAMSEAWLTGFHAIADELKGMQDRCRELFPDWSVEDLAQWKRPEGPPEAIRFGECPLPLQLVKHGIPEDKRLDPGVRRLLLPAALVLEEQPRLIISVEGAGRKAAVEVLQLLMLRFLTSMPAGKLRFTIIDPSALGENFAAFMHLADYDEQLVGGRIWTDSKQIDERLSLISEHMEKVLQKYLRNEFATIGEYNETAGEVSEPYHVIVAANFPAGFSEAAARKLVTISQSGPRCGVYTLLSIDTQLRLPHEFKLQELMTDAVKLEWLDNRLVWQYPLFEKLPLELDRVPEADRLSDLLRTAGQQSREASKVEVPFALVAPKPEELWAADSARELVVPIGRAGAKELQTLRLGIGTSQHALVAGKTGSGKSTLLHALITNLALHYSPDQVEFYLIDFKKGVEFKAYATGRLPHARVIAIESEREFGVSVLERLDLELRRRGELLREAGVQDLAGFRRARPDVSMPRTLLIIDEFQELFVADDRLAQDAALLLDRLVRQGRAFGIHVMLGSQTLAGAYSLARSTLGQMAVRIALECSEADAHLILSDENTAARLLSRPGEAIYNDQNGLLVGNHPFQVVWLPDAQRQQYLAGLRERPASRMPTDEPAIVFEGNVPADPRDNPALVAAISHPERTTHMEPTTWLGSAVRIEPATNIMLRRQGGHNLAIIGQNETMAAGMLATAVVALAAQHGEAGAKFTVLDGTRADSSAKGMWSEVAATVGEAVQVLQPRSAAQAVEALAEEVARRGQSPEERYGSVYLVVYDLAQFRDLRQTEDDYSFSFSGNGKKPSVDRRFREILKEGPAVGVHVLLWSESYNSLTRSVDRLTLREIEYRVAMQMSAADSTSVIDSPAATLLGEHRALLYRDDIGTQTKFRPYGRPSGEWLAWAAQYFDHTVATKV